MKWFVVAKDCVNRARQHYDMIERDEACRKKHEARLEGLKCLSKKSVVALLIAL